MKQKEKEKRNSYAKLQKDVVEDIRFFIKMLKTEVEWLEQHSEAKIEGCASPRDLRYLVKLRGYLETSGREMRGQNYLHGEEEGEVTELLYVGEGNDDFFDPDTYGSDQA